jgi:hypothetical protein
MGDPGKQNNSWKAFLRWNNPIQSWVCLALCAITSAAIVRIPWKYRLSISVLTRKVERSLEPSFLARN